MRIAIYLGHPAHFHLFKYAVKVWGHSHGVIVTYNSKDVLVDLVRSWDEDVTIIDLKSERRGNGALSLAGQFVRKEFRLLSALRKQRPDIILGTSIIVAHVGKLLGIPSVIFNEDDFDVIAASARIGYPFATHIVAPRCCRTGRWSHKVVAYDGYHELAYLGPRHFTPNPGTVDKLGNGTDPYFIVRFASLTAHHDFGRRGIGTDLARRLVNVLAASGQVYITSERPLEPEFEPHRLKLNPSDIHHALAFADLYVGDSQTMAAEAAVLGTPSLRFNDFVGRLSYLDELEARYGLTFGIRRTQPDRLLDTVKELLSKPNLKSEWRRRQRRMLKETIDVSAFMVWLIDSYPNSMRAVRADPAILGRFSFKHHDEPILA